MTPKTSEYRLGDQVQIHDEAGGQWVDCTVVEVCSSGAVQVSAREGYWLFGNELAQRLRPSVAPGKGFEAVLRSTGVPHAAGGMMAARPPSMWSRKTGALEPQSVADLVPTGYDVGSPPKQRGVAASSSFESSRSTTYDPSSPVPSAGSSSPELQNFGIFGNVSGLVPESALTPRQDSFQALGSPHGMHNLAAVDDSALPASLSFASAASMGSRAQSFMSSAEPVSRRAVGFSPSVHVMAFKETNPAGRLQSLGRAFQTDLQNKVQVPQAWSFASASSIASSASFASSTSSAAGTRPSIWQHAYCGELDAIPEDGAANISQPVLTLSL
mmetsp:Transcript_89762/g.231743  ORF Transcript_89762/g.231743 Transcript_89762/m.231743 type:complete len:328 (-) Transcript_89762:51-1034(-)|eukprot:CAMPEP_0195068756 /NCGR_PEP_ID=MMETSP0448-20130528/13331_1 /TAXON_ID=66468 /ORGANISM="Heterocapsa triquestra, Strain CCMP 448" /LENGTH=327 /DNA_ID=CAMNT_0040100299 /DNA_START=120 /DNA_END=1103 /DNA_ORIENTATION=+